MKVAVWAYLDNNLGDDLMIKLLVENFKEDTFYLYSRSKFKRNNFKNYDNVIVKDIKMIGQDIKEINAFITLGGSMFNNLKSLKGKFKQTLKILLLGYLKKRKIKIATIGCNFGKDLNKIELFLLENELKKNNLVTVRDYFSYSLIEKNNWHYNYHLADDIVYLLDFSIRRKFKNCLGITIYRSNSKKINNNSYIFLAKIIDNYIEKTNQNVKLFAFNSGKENDIMAADYILKLVKNKKKVIVISYLDSCEEVLNEFATCDCHLAIRFHGIILSNIMGIPCLPIAYSDKTTNFLADNNFKEFIKIEALNTMKMDVEDIVDRLRSKKNLFVDQKAKRNAKKHFIGLKKLLT